MAISSEEKISYNDAIRCFNRVIEIDPLDQNAWINRGVALLSKGDNKESIKSLEKALEINPKNYYAYLNIGICFLRSGKFEKALYFVNEALKLYNIESLYWHNKYNSFITDKNYIDADSAYNNEFIINVEMSWVLTLKGDIISRLALRNQESFLNALRAYEEAIGKYRFNILAWCGRCIAFNFIREPYYSRKACLDAISHAYLLNQNTPYIEIFEWPRHWRSLPNW
jgi:Flp pilus assembly protein TadD/uncharacterized protein YegP (UPF0339 family)